MLSGRFSGSGFRKCSIAFFCSPYFTSLITAVQGNAYAGKTASPNNELIKVDFPFLKVPMT